MENDEPASSTPVTETQRALSELQDQYSRIALQIGRTWSSMFARYTEDISHLVSRASSLSTQPMHDPVNHPAHYTFGSIEVIEVIEDWELGYHLGNAVKYIARAPHKGHMIEDLEKARWYLSREIQNLKEEEDEGRTDPTDI